jgi:uncharacterized protein
VGCGRIAPQHSLRRLAVVGHAVVVDDEGRMPGRGAYVCNARCARDALDRRAFGRAFRRAVSANPEFIESLT